MVLSYWYPVDYRIFKNKNLDNMSNVTRYFKGAKIRFLLLFLMLSNHAIAQEWERTFLHDFGFAKGFDVIQTSDNGYVMVGEVDLPTGAIRHYIWLVKTDYDGNQLWSKIYSGGDIANQTGRAIVEASNGDLFIAGSDFNKASVLKTNMNGDSLWTRNFGGQGINAFRDITQDVNGNLILVGQFEEVFNSGLQEVWAMGMNTDGDSLWSESYFEPSFSGSSAMGISALSANDFLVVGDINGQGFSIKINGMDGHQEWSNTYQLSVGDNLYAGSAHAGGDSLIMGGNITGFAGYSPVFFTTGPSGVLSEFVNFSPVSFGTITTLESTTDGGVVLTGSNYDFWGPEQSNMAGFVVKLDAELAIEWSLSFADSLDKQGASIKQDLDGNYILAGNRKGGMWLKKIMGNPTAIDEVAVDYVTVKVHPNPAHDNIIITIPEWINTEGLSISIYDTTGRLVAKNNIIGPVHLLDVGQLPRGVYHYSVQNTNQHLINGKIILQ
jgi:hypothetical protein